MTDLRASGKCRQGQSLNTVIRKGKHPDSEVVQARERVAHVRGPPLVQYDAQSSDVSLLRTVRKGLEDARNGIRETRMNVSEGRRAEHLIFDIFAGDSAIPDGLPLRSYRLGRNRPRCGATHRTVRTMIT